MASSISGYGSTSLLQQALLSSLKRTSTTDDETTATTVADTVTTTAGTDAESEGTSFEEKLAARLAADVEAGTLSEDDADLIAKTFDELAQSLGGGGRPAGGPPPGGAGGPPPGGAGGPPPGGGMPPGGAAGGAETESDSSATTSVYETALSLLKQNAEEEGTDSGTATAYLSKLLSGGLVDTRA
ncbi:hypothetical protein [Rhodospirillum centenum]|uniref:Suppressor protein n=1 Tax=Rhodospirillum centenum (strain ATCC 51521 / SW) TaxID=414684 RepID=B6IY44_RHOCS|nr:hypothetical protein [Rhodospirillum centenum]ACJ01218.1 suppressor protein [Rhodospirillum centenum SW]